MKILLSRNKEIIREYIEQGSKIGFIATASELEIDRWYMEKDKKDLIDMNFKLIDIDITNENKKSILEKFNFVDVIFVAGGNCFYLLQQLKRKEVLKELIEFANNKIYVGTSAGSCIACPSIEYADKLDDKTKAPLLEDYNGMNLIDAYILPHYKSKEKYTKLADKIINKNKNLKFIKLANEQAIIVNDRNDYKVINMK